SSTLLFYLFLLNATPPPELHTLSLHDALPIYPSQRISGREDDAPRAQLHPLAPSRASRFDDGAFGPSQELHQENLVVRERHAERSEEHTSELQSRGHLVCRLLLEKKKQIKQSQ